jgi:hypothetical protein
MTDSTAQQIFHTRQFRLKCRPTDVNDCLRSAEGVWCGNLKKMDHMDHLGSDGRIILIWILEKRDGGCMDSIDLD